ncbi:uncharacterized protein c8h22orf15 isoform X2 [Nelusetta ayraudi]
MFNLNCQLINFIRHLKQRGGVDITDSVDLMDTSGRLMKLQEKQDSVEPAGSVLVERRHYVLLRVHRGDGAAAAVQYVPLVDSACSSHPEFTELLKKLTNPARERHARAGRPPRTRRHKE